MIKKYNLILIFSIVLLPSTVFANGITPLLVASVLHFVVGNLLLGVIEGFLLRLMFKTPKGTVLLLIVANYASAIGGIFLFSIPLADILNLTIENIGFWYMIFVVVAFFITLLIEFPFFWFVLREDGVKWSKVSLKKALKATPIIHVITYLLLLGWYYGTGVGRGMIPLFQVVSASEFQPREEFSLYFMDPKGDHIYQSDLDGDQLQEISSLDQHNLFVQQDVLIHLESNLEEKEREHIIKERLMMATGMSGVVRSLAPESDRRFSSMWYEGIRRDRKVRFSVETPFADWKVRSITHLEGDILVFQLGDDQICMIDLESNRVALITRGKWPVVVKNKHSE